MSKKEIHYQGLAELSVIVEDTSALSPDYFRVTKLPTELTAGLNTFKFKGQPYLFPEDTEVYIEILDANGEPIYYEVNLDLESEEQPAIVSIYITQDTTPGNGTIIICAGANQTAEGEILDPSEINVRWQVPIYIDISKRNEDAIIFNTLPIVNLISATGSHKEITYYDFNSTYPAANKSQTQSDSFTTSGDRIKYYYNNDTPTIIVPSNIVAASYSNGAPINGFLSHIENATISFTYNRIVNSDPTRPSNIIQQTVSASISGYSGSLIAYLDSPLSYALTNSNNRFYPKSLDLSRLTVEYVMPTKEDDYGYVFSKTTENTYNIITASFSELIPVAGEIAKIRTYYKSSGINEYILLNDTDITSYADEFGFTTSSLQAIFSLPTSHRNEKIDFKFEFVNPAGNASKQIIEVKDTLFNGGNTYIGGDDNLMTGSLYVAGATGTGVHISGKGSSAMIRSIGYNGFYRATHAGPGGFVIYSGSVQPLLNASESYSGVGIELVANSSSYFKYTTSGSGTLDIKTDTFFLGNPSSSYIAGSPAGITISSSNFYLNQSGSITMTGNINANTGIFGNVNIIGTAITGSILLTPFYPVVTISEYLIEPWFTGSNAVYSGSVLNRPVSQSCVDYVSTGLFNWSTAINDVLTPFIGGITGSRYNTLSQIDGYSSTNPKYFDKWGSIVGSYKGNEYQIVESGSWTNTIDNAIFTVSAGDVQSLTSDVIQVDSSLLSADNLEPLELQVAARFIRPGVNAGWITGSDNKFTVEVYNTDGEVVVESTQYQTDIQEWLNFNIPISPGLFTHPVVSYSYPSLKPIKSFNKFYIKLSWSSVQDPIYGSVTPGYIRISELRIVRLAKSLGLKTSAIQFDSTFFSSTPISTEHFGDINPTQDNHSSLGSYDFNQSYNFNHQIAQKRWKGIYSANLYATDAVTIGAFGNSTTASGSLIIGYSNTITDSATGTTVIGNNNYAKAGTSLVQGDRNSATWGNDIHAQGGRTHALGNKTHTEGENTVAGFKSPLINSLPVSGGYGINFSGSYSYRFPVGSGIVVIGDTSNYELISTHIITSSSYSGTQNLTKLNVNIPIDITQNIAYILTHYSNNYDQTVGFSHAEGGYTTAFGNYSHAEGSGSYSYGIASHAEGKDTVTTGDYSHAEGLKSLASSNYSHAEGYLTSASAQFSHTEGYLTKAYSTAGHAEGLNSSSGTVKAYYSDSIAAGVIYLYYGNLTSLFIPRSYIYLNDNEYDDIYTVANFRVRSSSYSAPSTTIVYLDDTTVATTEAIILPVTTNLYYWTGTSAINAGYSHAEGYSNASIGDYSHAEGSSTVASGESSHAEGASTYAIGYASHTEGGNTRAVGSYSHAEGYSTIAEGAYQHVQGIYNITSSVQAAFIHGNGTSDTSRSNLIFAAGNTVQITGSLNIAGTSIITGSVIIGSSSLGPNENTLTLGARDAVSEGGQIGFNAPGGTYTSASFIDNYQNQFRILKGTNASSTAMVMSANLHTNNTQFFGAVTASAYSGLPNDYLYVTRATTNQTIGSGTWANRDVIFNNAVVSKGISYNTGTGLASLTGGKVYRITSRLAWSAAGAYLLEFSCYDSSNTQLGPITQIVQSTNGSNNISDGTLDFIYAPGSNVDIKIRTTNNTTALTGESIRYDLNTQLIIQQIA